MGEHNKCCFIHSTFMNMDFYQVVRDYQECSTINWFGSTGTTNSCGNMFFTPGQHQCCKDVTVNQLYVVDNDLNCKDTYAEEAKCSDFTRMADAPGTHVIYDPYTQKC